jgi:signal transduction histidine kinase
MAIASSRPEPPERPTDQPSPPTTDGDSQAKREETDQSLRTERHTADGRDKLGTLEDADRVVDLARDRADAILAEARDKADRGPGMAVPPEAVAENRAEADALLQDERAAADELLRRERQDSARILSALLPLARNSTDWKLLTERASSDAALSYRDDFLGMVSHDLNNLLSGIVMSASLLARRASEAPHIALATERIQLYAARMKRLIADLTDVTSLTAGKLRIASAPNDGKALLAEAIATFQPLALEKRISLSVDVPDVPLPLACDGERILQVLANLLGNAVKFTPDGGVVSARAERIADGLSFSIADTGPGIPETLLEAVFERFWQAAGNGERKGLGLGLYIAKSIVDAHGGRIWAESRIGEGATFHFTLPTEAAMPASGGGSAVEAN